MMLENTLQIEPNLKRLPEVVSWFEQFNTAYLLPTQWEQAKLALIEGFTNAVRHAQKPEATSQLLLLKAELNECQFWFEIWDQGAPYNFDWAIHKVEQTLKSPAFNPLEREKQWGSVIFLRLMQNHNWIIHYSRYQDTYNCFHAEVQPSHKKQTQQQF